MWDVLLLRNRILDLLINRLLFCTLAGLWGVVLRSLRGLFDAGITFKASASSCSTFEALLDGFHGGLLLVLSYRQLPWCRRSDVKATITRCWLVSRQSFRFTALFTLRLLGILGAVTITLRRGYGRLEFKLDAKREYLVIEQSCLVDVHKARSSDRLLSNIFLMALTGCAVWGPALANQRLCRLLVRSDLLRHNLYGLCQYLCGIFWTSYAISGHHLDIWLKIWLNRRLVVY